MSTHRPRRVGLGTKPQEEENGNSSEVSVQEEGSKQVPETGAAGDSEGGYLEMKAPQNLESEPETAAEGLPEPSQGGTDLLAELLKESAPKSKPEAATDGDTMFRGKQYAVGIDHATGDEKSVMAVIRMGEDGLPDELVQAMNLERLGQQPNGKYRWPVEIQEGYIEGCKQQAEADEVSLTEWLSRELAERLEYRFAR